MQLGLTARPKRDTNADTYKYFGEPVYTYALKEGIGDGFLTPFKVRQMASTMDTYTFSDEDEVIAGEIDPDKEYKEADFNTKLIIDEREMSRVQEFMDQIDQRQKTLVYLVHAGSRRPRPQLHQPDQGQSGPALLRTGDGGRRQAGRTAPARIPG